MVVLEHVKINELKLDSFPQFKCLCELCDDGCFDRRKQKHHPDCKRQYDKSTTSMVRNGSSTDKPCPSLSSLTHYRETFRGNFNPRPATMCQPRADSYYSSPRGDMQFDTANKRDFKPYESFERAKSMKKIEKYEKNDTKMSGTTSYASEYFAKELKKDQDNKPSSSRKNPNDTHIKIPAGQISSSTTSKEFFKNWPAPKLERGYSEYPSLVGMTLFPNGNRQFSTSTSDVHHKFEITPRVPIKSSKPELSGSLKVEGDMTLNTNYRDTFVKYQNFERQKAIVPKTNNETVIFERHRPTLSKSQTSMDFIRYPNFQRPKPANCNPYISDLNDQIYPGEKLDLTTMYSIEFAKIDPSLIEKAKSCKRQEPVYEAPKVKIESETVTKRDFRPIDLKNVPLLRGKKIEGKLKVNTSPMETKTMSMLQFIPYKVQPIKLAKDPHPSYYSPIKARFVAQSTTKETFTGAKGERVESLKPREPNLKIDKAQSMDMATHYRGTFIDHGLSLCQSKAFLIAQSLARSTRNDSAPLKREITNTA